ncbi:MAG: PorT family protein [Prevotella sp.]|nr:PorT family protein [Prevotella sp.]
MKRNIAIAIITALTLSFSTHAWAQFLNKENLEMKARVGYNLGGTAPVGIPATIRSIDAYRLTPSFMLGFDVMLPLDSKWGVMAGLRIENKGMDADVTTKAYHMEMKKGSDLIEGLFTGKIQQDVTEWMLTVPVQATYKLSDKVMLKGGPYVSLLLDKDFSGIASGGYLRQGDPTGAKIIIGDKEGEWATYDFSDDMRTFQFGVGVGADWQCWTKVGFSADLNWGLNGIFKSSFKTVEQSLFPIYGTLGVFYKF